MNAHTVDPHLSAPMEPCLDWICEMAGYVNGAFSMEIVGRSKNSKKIYEYH